MSMEENLNLERAVPDTLNARDWERFDEIHAESLVPADLTAEIDRIAGSGVSFVHPHHLIPKKLQKREGFIWDFHGRVFGWAIGLRPHIARTIPTMEVAFSGDRVEVVYHPKIPSNRSPS